MSSLLRAGLIGLALAACNGPATMAAPDQPLPIGAAPGALTLGQDLDGDGDPDEVEIRLEIIEVQEEVYPGEFVTFWVFAPEGQGMTPVARAPSPTIRVEEGDRVRIRLLNTHYFPHTIHLHGAIHPNDMDGVPDITQPAVKPGEAFDYEFVAKNPGTHFYHCHVQPDVHVLMGLVGMLIIEPDRPENHFAHLIPGAGSIAGLTKAALEHYDKEYSLVYMEIDDRLNRIAAAYSDPREIEKRMHREYDSTQRRPNIFMLNGRAFPFTLRDTPIEVDEGDHVRLRILNAGARTMHLHTHGHHPTETHLDGYELSPERHVTRDVFAVGPAQRVDLDLHAGSDDRLASGPGVWLMHDHTEQTVTNKGISPGGDVTTIVYDGFMEATGLPKVATSLDRFLDPDYYLGRRPVFDPSIFGTNADEYEYGWSEAEPVGGEFDYPVRDGLEPIPRSSPLEGHEIAASSCPAPRSSRTIEIRGGVRFARPGEVFGFEPRAIRVGKCERVTVVFENLDEVRHALMLPGLNPMFISEFAGPGKQTETFVTPDEDITLEFHCHVESHEKMGMHGRLIVGKGSPRGRHVHAHEEPEAAERLFSGVGTILSVDRRKSRIIIDHEEIPGFMAPMVMSYAVEGAALLKDLSAEDEVRFTIDAGKRAIVDIKPLP